MKHPHHVLVIGCGSIGERHLRTFGQTGRAELVACDSRPAIRERMKAQYGVGAVEDWLSALRSGDFTEVVVATPAPLHIDMAVAALEAGRHVLIEKPLATNVEHVGRLLQARDKAGRFVAVAYVYHCNPAFAGARDFIRSGRFGPVRHVVVSTGQHFPTFRPAYREIYYRDHAQGGGAIQDALTHMANAVEWFVGPTRRLFCDAAHQVLEDVEVEDTVNVTARNGDVLVNYALNQFQAPNEHRLDFHAERGSVRIELDAQRWGIMARGDAGWTWHPTPIASRDAQFVAQANAFLDGTEGRPNSLCTVEEGLQTLRFNLAALESWRRNGPVEIDAA